MLKRHNIGLFWRVLTHGLTVLCLLVVPAIGHASSCFTVFVGNSQTGAYRGETGTSERVAQSFTVPSNCTVTDVLPDIYNTVAAVDDTYLEIDTDNAGEPSGTPVGGTGTVSNLTLGFACGSPPTVTLSSPASLTSGTTYWLVLSRSGTYDSTNEIATCGPSGYGGGLYIRRDSGTWLTNLHSGADDMNFELQDNTGGGGSGTDDTSATSTPDKQIDTLFYGFVIFFATLYFVVFSFKKR